MYDVCFSSSESSSHAYLHNVEFARLCRFNDCDECVWLRRHSQLVACDVACKNGACLCDI